MRLVAAAKVRRAQEAVLSTRPFNEGLQSVFSGLVKRLALENIELPLLQVHTTLHQIRSQKSTRERPGLGHPCYVSQGSTVLPLV